MFSDGDNGLRFLLRYAQKKKEAKMPYDDDLRNWRKCDFCMKDFMCNDFESAEDHYFCSTECQIDYETYLDRKQKGLLVKEEI